MKTAISHSERNRRWYIRRELWVFLMRQKFVIKQRCRRTSCGSYIYYFVLIVLIRSLWWCLVLYLYSHMHTVSYTYIQLTLKEPIINLELRIEWCFVNSLYNVHCTVNVLHCSIWENLISINILKYGHFWKSEILQNENSVKSIVNKYIFPPYWIVNQSFDLKHYYTKQTNKHSWPMKQKPIIHIMNSVNIITKIKF